MITRHVRGPVTWVDLESPSTEELNSVMQEFGIDGRIGQEVSRATPYPLVVSSSDYLYLILHFPTAEPRGGIKTQEIDFIIGKQFFITARYETIDSLHSLHKIFEAEELLGTTHNPAHADVLLERVMRHLYNALREEVETIGRQLDRIEQDIFSGKERKTVRTISQVNRVLLRFDLALGRHAESLSSLLAELSLPQFFGKQFTERSALIDAEREHAESLVASYRELGAELRDTNDSLLSASQNEVMKTLTVITFIILPLTLITSLFQMNVDDVPFAHGPYAFWKILITVIILTGLLVFYTRKKRWI